MSYDDDKDLINKQLYSLLPPQSLTGGSGGEAGGGNDVSLSVVSACLT